MKTGNTAMRETGRNGYQTASMEPGHEDREYLGVVADSDVFVAPQWSPVMKTGNTVRHYGLDFMMALPQWSPVMKTGNTRGRRITRSPTGRLNGARS